MQYLIGVDAGSTNTKVIIFDENGRETCSAQAHTPVRAEDGHYFLYDEEYSALMLSLIKEAVHKLPGGAKPGDIAGVAFTGMAESGFALDAHGRSVYPLTLWYDQCTRGMEKEFSDVIGTERLIGILGQLPQYNFSANKIVWLEGEYPEEYSRMKKWLCVPDYFAYRLTANMGMNYSTACRTQLFDINTSDWSDELLGYAGIERSMLPPVMPSHALVGRVTREASALCGLKEGTPVFAGGHDHICGAFAAGALEDGALADSSGTAEALVAAFTDRSDTVSAARKGFNVGTHVVPGLYYMLGSVPSSGRTVDWYKSTFPSPGGEGASRAGANGIMFLPHLSGGSSPKREVFSRGAFACITASHTHADFMQSVYEGLCYELRKTAEAMVGTPTCIVTMGGGSKNSVWMQTKANIFNMDITVPDDSECTAKGAALLAGLGAGLFSSPADAVKRTFRTGAVYSPQPVSFDYEKGYESYKRLSEALREYDMSEAQEDE